VSAVCVCSDAMKAIRTELSLTRDEFESYTVGVDAEVTFCLKEFRVRAFCMHCLSALTMLLICYYHNSCLCFLSVAVA